ncbi:hypothetical protein NST94_27190 [Paenibacillus sp. FSL H8-0282]|nr:MULTISPECIES: hypothetical protein [Paenibacillus]MDH6444814.1 hypothetical protein [Paenibacillus sp. PastF-4]
MAVTFNGNAFLTGGLMLAMERVSVIVSIVYCCVCPSVSNGT